MGRCIGGRIGGRSGHAFGRVGYGLRKAYAIQANACHACNLELECGTSGRIVESGIVGGKAHVELPLFCLMHADANLT